MTMPNRGDAAPDIPPQASPSAWPTRLVAMVESRSGPILVVLGLAGALIAAVIARSGGSEISFYDEGDYLSLATNLADGIGYSLDGVNPTAYRPPGLPAVLSLVALVQSDLLWLRVVNSLLFGVAIVLAGLLGRRIAGGLAGVLAACATLVAPVSLYTATKLYPQTLATVLLLAALLALLGVERSGSRRLVAAGAAGLLLAALTLTVPNHGVTLVVGLLWLAWRMRRAALVPALVLVVAFSLPIGAWTARNAEAVDGFVPASTNGGYNLLLGNTDGAGAGTGTNVDITEFTDEALERRLNEVETDEFYRDNAVEWITANPVDAARLYVAKVANTFSVQQELATDDQQPSSAATLVLAVTYLPVLLLFLARPFLVRLVPLRRGEGLLIAAFWANVAAMALAFTRIRFRVPLDPIMVVVVAVLVAGSVERWTSAGRPSIDPSSEDHPVPAGDRTESVESQQ